VRELVLVHIGHSTAHAADAFFQCKEARTFCQRVCYDRNHGTTL
jgi:hypothetical protein